GRAVRRIGSWANGMKPDAVIDDHGPEVLHRRDRHVVPARSQLHRQPKKRIDVTVRSPTHPDNPRHWFMASRSHSWDATSRLPMKTAPAIEWRGLSPRASCLRYFDSASGVIVMSRLWLTRTP